MRTIEIDVLDERERAFVRLLERAGIGDVTARIIICLMVRNGITPGQIAVTTQASAAAVSKALKKLLEDGVVRKYTVGRGRRYPEAARYSLTGEIDRVLGRLEDHKREEILRYVARTEKIKKTVPARYRTRFNGGITL